MKNEIEEETENCIVQWCTRDAVDGSEYCINCIEKYGGGGSEYYE